MLTFLLLLLLLLAYFTVCLVKTARRRRSRPLEGRILWRRRRRRPNLHCHDVLELSLNDLLLLLVVMAVVDLLLLMKLLLLLLLLLLLPLAFRVQFSLKREPCGFGCRLRVVVKPLRLKGT